MRREAYFPIFIKALQKGGHMNQYLEQWVGKELTKRQGSCWKRGGRTPGNPFAAAPGRYRLKTAVWAGVSFSRTMEAEAYVTTSRHSFV